MKWRSVDNMIVSKCIQIIQDEINEGKKQATDFINFPGVNEEKAKEFFDAWSVYLIDRMMEESDKNNWGEATQNPMSELEYDVEYYRRQTDDIQ
jgi:hypothetical protein